MSKTLNVNCERLTSNTAWTIIRGLCLSSIIVEGQNKKRGQESALGSEGMFMKVECRFLRRMAWCIMFDS